MTVPQGAFAAGDATAAIAEFTGGAEAGSGDLTLTAPEIAENGNTVPIEVNAPGAVAIAVYAAGNPEPAVAQFKFGKLAGPLRAALAGRAVTPSVFDMMLVLGREETLARLEDAAT
ncbi:MAG: thiosulfate oxidation carrier protein SoxY [Pseudomonadota bacterium]